MYSWVLVYIDDISTVLADEATYDKTLREVLDRFRTAGLRLDAKKSSFQTELGKVFSGQVASGDGINATHRESSSNFASKNSLK